MGNCMILFPAIDLKEGKCVRLRQGDFEDYFAERDFLGRSFPPFPPISKQKKQVRHLISD